MPNLGDNEPAGNGVTSPNRLGWKSPFGSSSSPVPPHCQVPANPCLSAPPRHRCPVLLGRWTRGRTQRCGGDRPLPGEQRQREALGTLQVTSVRGQRDRSWAELGLLSPSTPWARRNKQQEQTGKITSMGKPHPRGTSEAEPPESDTVVLTGEDAPLFHSKCPGKNSPRSSTVPWFPILPNSFQPECVH